MKHDDDEDDDDEGCLKDVSSGVLVFLFRNTEIKMT